MKYILLILSLQDFSNCLRGGVILGVPTLGRWHFGPGLECQGEVSSRLCAHTAEGALFGCHKEGVAYLVIYTVPAYIHIDIYSSPSFMVITAALKVNGNFSGRLVCVLSSHPTPTLVVMYSK
jgi:hypothetical protein